MRVCVCVCVYQIFKYDTTFVKLQVCVVSVIGQLPYCDPLRLVTLLADLYRLKILIFFILLCDKIMTIKIYKYNKLLKVFDLILNM